MRVLAFFIPSFRLKAHLRQAPELSGKPLYLMSAMPPRRGEVLEASADARALGVRPGMRLGEAQALAPAAEALASDEVLYERERAALCAELHTLSPRVACERPAILYLDATRMERLYPDERDLATKVAEACARGGYRGRAGIASVKGVARLAAIHGKGIAIVREGDEADFLAPLPIEALAPPGEMHEALLLLGVKTIGDLALMPAEGIRSRFGEEGLRLHRLARGLPSTFIAPPPEDGAPPAEPAASLILECPLAELPPLLFVLRGLLDEVSLPLLARGRGIKELSVELRLDAGDDVTVPLTLPRVMTTPRVLLELLALSLRDRELASPVSEVVVRVVESAELSHAQRSLFSSRHRNPERLEAALARLRDRLGDGGALTPRLQPSVRPEGSFRLEPFDPGGRSTTTADLPDYPVHYPSSLRLIHPPRPLEVLLQGDEVREIRSERLRAQVVASFGPDRLSGEWWSSPFARDYFKVATRDGGLYWIYRELSGERGWHLHGIFD